MPFNMAANEVLANRANEILTGYKGSDQVHPNTHVNMCQSSNDVVPTAKGIAIHNEVGRVLKAAAHLEAALDAKAAEFADVVKMGRTCLQDAVPITLGQEFSGYAAGIRRNRLLLERERARWCTGVLCATAVGTGMDNARLLEHIYKNLQPSAGVRFAVTPICSTAFRLDFIILPRTCSFATRRSGPISRWFRLKADSWTSSSPQCSLASIMPGKINWS
ncbi:MAG: lyase family protein [Bilophila wadsworthia]